MGRFKLRTALIGLASMVAFASSLYADSSVDAAFDDNQNDFEYYWYYYDDNAGVGLNDRPYKAPTSTPSVINVVYTDSVRHAFGDATDTYVIKAYTFTTGTEGAEKYASMPFTFGDAWIASYGSASPYVGLGTSLCKDGNSIDLTGATAISFKVKSKTNSLTGRFKVQTKEIDDISNVVGSALKGDEFGYYGAAFTATTSWTTVTINIADLALPGTWARKIDFNIKACTKLAWELVKTSNTAVTTDELMVDDITVIGYTFVSPSIFTATIPLTSIPTSGLYSDFDADPKNESKLLTYWYAYNDAQIGGTSSVSKGAVQDATTKLLTLEWLDGTGSSDAGYGPAVEYTLGPVIDQNGTKVAGFIGIGCNMYDSAASLYWDGTAAGAKSILFHYKTDGDMKVVTFELSDVNDVADASKPTQTISKRGSGVVYYRNLPATGGTWKAVELPFDSLIYHDDWQGSSFIALDKSKIAKVQWKIQGGEGTGGKFQIDNIYFPGVTTWKIGALPVKMARTSAQTANFNVAFLNGNINVSWKNAQTLAGGKVSLVNARGAVVASKSIANTADLSADFSSKRLPAGMYFVTLNAVNTNGKAVTMQQSISLVK